MEMFFLNKKRKEFNPARFLALGFLELLQQARSFLACPLLMEEQALLYFRDTMKIF